MTTRDDGPTGATPRELPVATAVRAPGPGSRRLGLTVPAVVVGSLLVLGGVVLWKNGGADDDDDDLGDDDRPGLFAKKRDDTNATLRQMERLKDRLCDCADQACAEDVMSDMTSMPSPRGKPSKAQMERAMKISEEMSECQRRLLDLDAPPDLEDDE